MRKRFKIKKLIRNNRYTFLSKGKEALCPPLEGGPKSSISRRGTQAKRAFIIRAILGGGVDKSTLTFRMPVATQHAPFRHTAAVSLHPRGSRCLAVIKQNVIDNAGKAGRKKRFK